MPIVERRGPEDATDAWLFVHGLPGDRRVFAPVAARAPRGAHLALLDLPDHGEQADDPSLDPAALEVDVDRALETLGSGRAVTLVGFGAGAYVCGRLLARAGDRVARAVLVSGFASQPDEIVEQRLALALELETGELAESEHRALVLRQWLGEGQAGPEVLRAASALLDAPRARLCRAWRRFAACTAPVAPYQTVTTVVHALGDRVVSRVDGEALADLGEHALVITLETDAHLLPLTHAAEIAELVYSRTGPSQP